MEEDKINKEEGTILEVTGQQIKTLWLALTNYRKGPIDLEKKYKLEQGTI